MDDRHKERLRWRGRRGLLELDIKLTRFFAHDFDTLNDTELKEFEEMLLLPDNDFLDMVMGIQKVQPISLEPMIARIRNA